MDVDGDPLRAGTLTTGGRSVRMIALRSRKGYRNVGAVGP